MTEPDVLEVMVDDGTFYARRSDGLMLGVGVAARVVPLMLAGLSRAGAAVGEVDGLRVRGVCTFEISETDLVTGRAGGRTALLWRDPTGSTLARTELGDADLAALLEHLESLGHGRLADVWRAERARTLAELAQVQGALSAAWRRQAASSETDPLKEGVALAREAYTAVLPRVPVARDPFTGDLVLFALDDLGLDGPFWDAERPERPVDDQAPTYVVTSGAMRLDLDHLESFQHLCVPGPEVPFVVPDLLARDGVRAVLATVPVGPHTGYAITYVEDGPHRDPVPNEWGRREYWRRVEGRPTTFGSSYDTSPAPDFDLRPWLEADLLLWVEPGDPTFTLRHGPVGCPYLDLPGRREHQRVQVGKVW